MLIQKKYFKVKTLSRDLFYKTFYNLNLISVGLGVKHPIESKENTQEKYFKVRATVKDLL
jgi:hypothetical protein